MRVYVARWPFVTADFNARTERVALASHWAVEKYPDNWRLLGTVDATTAALIEMLDDAAVLPRVWDRVTPGDAEQPAPETESRKAGPTPMTTREEVERTRQSLEEAHLPAGERSIAGSLGVSRDAVRYALGKDRH